MGLLIPKQGSINTTGSNSDSFEKDCIILDSHTTTTPPTSESDAIVPSNEVFLHREFDMCSNNLVELYFVGVRYEDKACPCYSRARRL